MKLPTFLKKRISCLPFGEKHEEILSEFKKRASFSFPLIPVGDFLGLRSNNQMIFASYLGNQMVFMEKNGYALLKKSWVLHMTEKYEGK